MCTGKAALCGWERGSSIPYTVRHIHEKPKDLQAGQRSAQDPAEPQCYFMHKQYFEHKPQYLKNNPLVNKLSENKYQAFPWRFGGAGKPAWVTNHSWQRATLQMPRSTFMALLPRGLWPLHMAASCHQSTPKAQLWLSPFPNHCFFCSI